MALWGLSWSDGDTADVELRVAADAEPIGVRGAAPLWAYFDRVPDAHDGAGEFSVRLRFGEDVDTDAAALRDSVLAVSGGSVTAVEAAAGSTSGWSVTVQPDGAGDVTVSVGGALGCADAAAVCTTDGRTLPAGIAVSVAGPAAPAPPQLSNLVLDAVAPAPLTSEQTRSETQALPAVSEATVAVTPKEAGSTGEVFAASGLTLNPAFSPDETLYIAQTPAGVTEVTVTAAAVRQDTAVEIAPQDADVTTEGHQVALVADGDTAISVTTTSADGTETLQYWVTVSPPFDLSSVAAGIDPQLSKLGTLSFNGLASLSFEPDQARYELAAPSGVTETIVIASPLFAGAGVELLVVRSDDPTLSIDRTVAAGPIAAGNIALSATGDTLVMLRVTSPDGQHQSLYVVLIHRDSQPQANNPSDSQLARFVGSSAASLKSQIAPRTSVPAAGDATLSDLTLTGATLSPSFSSATTSYTAEATADTDQVTLSITTADAAASTAISPADADPNTAGWQVALTTPGVGGAPSKTTISIVVGSADNASLNVYVVDVFRAAPESAPTAGQGNYVPQLVELSVNGLGVTAPGHSLIPSFSPGVYEYYVPGRSDTAEYEMNIRASTHPENDLHVSVEGDGTSVIRRWTYYHLDRSLGDGVFTGPTDDEVVARGRSILAGLSEGLNLVHVDVKSADRLTVRRYTLRIVVGPKSEDAELRSLVVRVGESSEDDLPLSPEFSSDKRFYTIKSAISSDSVLALYAYVPSNTATVNFESVSSYHSDSTAATKYLEMPIQGMGYSGKVAFFDIHDHTRARIHVKVTAEKRSNTNTYVLYVPPSDELHPTLGDTLTTDSDGLMELPSGCPVHVVVDTAGGLQTERRWPRNCNSHLEFYSTKTDGSRGRTTGYARFFKMVVDEIGEVSIGISRDRSYHLVLRKKDGTVIAHRHLETDGHCYIACDGDPIVETLAAGTYVVEVVQHYSWLGTRGYFTLDVDSDVLE